jgi:acetyltransferase-like isoleucine patch superfamily enzyme
MITGREKFKKNKKIIETLVKLFKLLPKTVLLFMWNCIANHSQIIFVGLRYIILKALVKSCGDNVKIGTNVQILCWEKLSIGTNVSIHSNCYIDAYGEIEIKDNVSIAHNSTILSTNHDWSDISLPIKYNPMVPGKVIVCDDVWIGCGCRVLAGVKIESRSVIAAGAVVNKDVKSKTIVGGVPAKIIKEI